MKIAIVLPDLRGGGAERLHVSLALDWTARGHTVEFVLMRARGELRALVPPAISIVDLQVDRTRQVPGALWSYLRSNRPDVLLAAMWPLTVTAVLAFRLARCRGRVVVSDHNVLSHMPQTHGLLKRAGALASIGMVYPLADARVGVSKGAADAIAQLGALPRESMTVIYNPAARGHIEPALREHDPWPGLPGKRVISVGTLKPVKDQATLIRAFALVRRNVQANLVILGEGSVRPELERLVAELGLTDCVQLPGFLLDPYPWYLHADLFVLTSLHEGFGNVIVEALECGLPVVSTDCETGPREILDAGKYGTLVPVGDVSALAEAIEQSLRAPRQPERQQERAAAFSVASASNAYLRLFQQASVGE